MYVHSNATEVRSFAQAHYGLLDAGARTQKRVSRAQVRGRRNRLKCVRTQKLRSTALSAPDFPETELKLKKMQTNTNLIFFLKKYFYLYKSTK
jgi:hypothetical protein